MNSNKLVEVIKTVVRAEMSKTIKPLLKEVLKPLLKETVENQVNAVLAERFIHSVSIKQSLVNEVLTEPQMSLSPEPQPQVNKRQIEEQRKRELLKKLGADTDPIASLIYEDIDMNQPLSGNSQLLSNGQIYDPEADDEGIDISMLGF